jgi:Xaa-Pro aminopeptidase
MVDAGTVELVRELGVDLVTSANLIQFFESRWTEEQLVMHLEAARKVDAIRRQAFERVGAKLRASERVTEWEMQQFILSRFAEEGLTTDHGPDIAVNSNASNPHYEPKQDASAEIKSGDLVLMDMWAKLDRPEAVFYDITWVGFCGAEPPARVERVFTVVRDARDRAIARVKDAVRDKRELRGFEVDDAAREHVRAEGFEEYFFHRTGHSIGTEVHGSGANMDNLETHDERRVIPWTCFSVEPGIYLPEFGIRLEVDVFVGDREARVTGEVQDKLVLI